MLRMKLARYLFESVRNGTQCVPNLKWLRTAWRNRESQKTWRTASQNRNSKTRHTASQIEMNGQNGNDMAKAFLFSQRVGTSCHHPCTSSFGQQSEVKMGSFQCRNGGFKLCHRLWHNYRCLIINEFSTFEAPVAWFCHRLWQNCWLFWEVHFLIQQLEVVMIAEQAVAFLTGGLFCYAEFLQFP